MAYTGTSIVDYLKSVGQASDFSSRTKLAQQYGITNYTGTAEQNLNLLGILNKPATSSLIQNNSATLTPTETQSYQDQINKISQQIKTIAPQIEAITTPTANQIQTSQSVSAPILQTPTAPTIKEQYTTSALTNLETQRKAVEDNYQKQLTATQEKAKQAQAKIDELTTQYKDTLEQAKPLTEPFRQALETSERERLKVEENYFANQTLVNELETLLTEVNTSLQAEKDITGLSSIRQPRIEEATNKATARIGVIEATMAARNNQISVANNLIDRTSAAITADRTDKLNYYNTLLSFYDKQRDEAGDKLLTLSKEEKGWLEAQTKLLENDLAVSQANVENIKSLMTSPESALLMAKAGVNLNMTPEEVNQAIATQVERDNIEEVKNKYVGDGYTFIPFPNLEKDTSNLMTISVGGKELTFRKPPETGTTTKTADIYNILSSVGIPTSVSSATGKLNKSYYDKLVSAGIPYEVVNGIWQNIIAGNTLEEIRQGIKSQGGDPTILDKFMTTLQGENQIINPFQ
jgi:chromosome segregation ATPase